MVGAVPECVQHPVSSVGAVQAAEVVGAGGVGAGGVGVDVLT